MVDQDFPTESEDDDRPADDGADDDGVDDDGAEEEISLDALTAAYAGLVAGGQEDPPGAGSAGPDAQAAEENAAAKTGNDEPAAAPGEKSGHRSARDTDQEAEPDADEYVSPLGILEAVLFVGNAENTPLTAKRIAALMRGVSPREIDKLVVELNERYAQLQTPYEVVSHGAGYSLVIRDEYAGLRDRFYGSVREARLSQAAIDILAVIAYGQPMTREEIDETRGKPAGGVLSQLVRRQLLRIERPDEKPRRPIYYTTNRFLKIMGLEDIAELPESQEFDRNF